MYINVCTKCIYKDLKFVLIAVLNNLLYFIHNFKGKSGLEEGKNTGWERVDRASKTPGWEWVENGLRTQENVGRGGKRIKEQNERLGRREEVMNTVEGWERIERERMNSREGWEKGRGEKE